MSYAAPSLSLKEIKLMLYGLCVPEPTFTEKDYPAFDGKVVLITGGNSGVGYETAKSLAGSTKAKIYIFSRNEKKSLDAIKKLKEEVLRDYGRKNVDINFIRIDMADLTTIKPAVKEFLAKEERLDLIIHNAGIMSSIHGQTTVQGYESHLGVNVIGPHLLQKLLDPIFIKTSKLNKPGESRIVWLASAIQFVAPKGGVNWDDVNNKNIKDMNYIYAQSKAMVIIQSKQWPKQHPESNHTLSSSVCPGLLKSSLQRDFGIGLKLFSRLFADQRYGAYSELYAAFSPEIQNGDYSIAYGRPGILRKDIEEDVENHERVWKFLEDQVKDFC